MTRIRPTPERACFFRGKHTHPFNRQSVSRSSHIPPISPPHPTPPFSESTQPPTHQHVRRMGADAPQPHDDGESRADVLREGVLPKKRGDAGEELGLDFGG